jgi:hypothetical protein
VPLPDSDLVRDPRTEPTNRSVLPSAIDRDKCGPPQGRPAPACSGIPTGSPRALALRPPAPVRDTAPAAGRPLATRARRLGPGQVATAGFPAGCSSRAGQAATRAVAVAWMLVAPIGVQELAVTPGSSRRTPRSRRARCRLLESFKLRRGGQDYSLSGLPEGAARRQPGTTCPVVCPGGRQSTAIRTARGAARWTLGANP